MLGILSAYCLLSPNFVLKGDRNFDEKVKFSKRLSTIRKETDQAMVLRILGKPRFKFSPETYQDCEMWCYSTGSTVFPDLGTVMFDYESHVIKTYGATKPQRYLRTIRGDIGQLLREISSSRGFTHHFNSRREVNLSKKVADLGPRGAGAVMREYLRVAPLLRAHEIGARKYPFEDPNQSTQNEGKVAVLCLTLLNGKVSSTLQPISSPFTPTILPGAPGFEFFHGIPVVTSMFVKDWPGPEYELHLVSEVESQRSLRASLPTNMDYEAAFEDFWTFQRKRQERGGFPPLSESVSGTLRTIFRKMICDFKS